MKVVEADSVECMSKLLDPVDVILSGSDVSYETKIQSDQ